MKLSKRHYYSCSTSYERTGRKRGCKVTICYTNIKNQYYFLVRKLSVNDKNDTFFNSCWKDMIYETEEDCIASCEKFIDDVFYDKTEVLNH